MYPLTFSSQDKTVKPVRGGFRFRINGYNITDAVYVGVDPLTYEDLYKLEIKEHSIKGIVEDRLRELANKLEKPAGEQDQFIHTEIVIDSVIKDEMIEQFKEFIEDKINSLEDQSNEILLLTSSIAIDDEYICFNISKKTGDEFSILKEIKIPVETEISDTLYYTIHDMAGKEYKFTKCTDDESVTIKRWPELHNFGVYKNGAETDFIYFSSIHIDRDRTVTYYMKKP